jgi:DNA-binding MarR family transcriptional regulator
MTVELRVEYERWPEILIPVELILDARDGRISHKSLMLYALLLASIGCESPATLRAVAKLARSTAPATEKMLAELVEAGWLDRGSGDDDVMRLRLRGKRAA